MRKTELYRVMPWVGGLNTSVDPGVLSSQELVRADNVVFSSSGARIKREALEYLDNDIPAPDFRSSSGTTRTLYFVSNPLVNFLSPDERLVVGEKINVSGVTNYVGNAVTVTSITAIAEVTTVLCVADVAGSLAGKYFLISGGDQGVGYYVWFKVSGTGTDPGIPGKLGVEVDISTGASAGTVASAVNSVLNAMSEFSTTVSTATVTVTDEDKGYTVAPGNGNSGFTTTVTTEGGVNITYEAESSLSESKTAAGSIIVGKASAVIWIHDYWRYVPGAQENEQLLVYATNDFQLFTLNGTGQRIQIHGQEQQTLIVTAAASTLTTGDHFLLNGANNITSYYVWYNKAGGGGNPSIIGRTGIEVDVGGGDTANQVATATKLAVDAVAGLSATVSTNQVTITTDSPGITDNTIDSNTGFTITTVAYGATNPETRLETIRMLVFNERLLIFFSGVGNFPVVYNPEDNIKYQLVVPNTVDGIAMPDASFGFIHLGRIFTNSKTDKDGLHYCETFDETLWLGLGDSGAIQINPGDGDSQGITNGYIYKEFAVIGKGDARYRMVGDSPENFIVQSISKGMGNEGPLAIPVDETDVIFISHRGVHSQQATDTYGDTDSVYISKDIKPSFNKFEQDKLKLIQGTYIPELNSIAISIADQGDQAQSSVWLYNFEVQVPNKDRLGAWYRWPNISCTALNRRLENSKHKLVFGTVNGRVVQAQKENNFADFGTTGILFNIKTGTIYPNNDPQSMKAFKKITMFYRPKGNFSFAVSAKIDNQQSQGFAFNEISGLDLLGETFILGSSLLGSSNTLAPFTFTMDGYGRGVTITVMQPTADEQIEIWGFGIEYENADLEQEVE